MSEVRCFLLRWALKLDRFVVVGASDGFKLVSPAAEGRAWLVFFMSSLDSSSMVEIGLAAGFWSSAVISSLVATWLSLVKAC